MVPTFPLPPLLSPSLPTLPTLNPTSPATTPRYQSPLQLACEILQPGRPNPTAMDLLYLQWTNGLSLSIPNRFIVWDNPTSPRIRTITAIGCGDPLNSTTTTLGCQGGEVLTLSGTNFLSSTFSMRMQPVTSDYYRVINYYI